MAVRDIATNLRQEDRALQILPTGKRESTANLTQNHDNATIWSAVCPSSRMREERPGTPAAGGGGSVQLAALAAAADAYFLAPTSVIPDGAMVYCMQCFIS